MHTLMYTYVCMNVNVVTWKDLESPRRQASRHACEGLCRLVESGRHTLTAGSTGKWNGIPDCIKNRKLVYYFLCFRMMHTYGQLSQASAAMT